MTTRAPVPESEIERELLTRHGSAGHPAYPRWSVTRRERPKRKGRSPVLVAIDYLGMTVLTLLFVAPIVYMIVGSLKPDTEVLDGLGGFVPRDVSLDNYGDVLARFDDPSTGYFLGFFGVS